jgi:type II secretory pathway component GspD/PulD (secretin)
MKRFPWAVIALLVVPAAFGATAKRLDRPAPVRFRPLSVTLDVKDEEARDVLKSLQRQCGIKNLIIDPQVQGKATFFFHDVPCNTAFDTVFRTFRLKAVVYSSSVATVEPTH